MKTAALPPACEEAVERIRPFLDGELPAEAAGALHAHCEACANCRSEFESRREVLSMLGNTYGQKRISDQFDTTANRRLLAKKSTTGPVTVPTGFTEPVDGEDDEVLAPAGFLSSLSAQFGSAPWWIISGAFHALLILLVFLIGMVVMQAKSQDVVIVTDLEKQEKPPEPEKKLDRDILPRPVVVTESEVVSEQTPMVTHEVVEFAEEVETDNDSDAHDTRGEDGISDAFLGGTGTVSALGTGGGGRAGAFGRPDGAGGRLRRAIKGGGGKPTESAVDKALEWLARHQEPDGHWDPRKYEGGKHDGSSEIGATGLALLAFLGAGHTERVGQYKDNVRRAVEWFIKNQADNGQFKCGSDPASSRMYGHGIATMAMSESAAMARNPETRKAAQKGVDFIAFAQNRTGKDNYEGAGWDYHPQGGTNDTSVTSWMVLALKSAKVAGLSIEPRCFEGGLSWLDAAQGKDEYKLGIWYRGEYEETKAAQAQNPRMNYNNPAVKENALLAAAGAMRMFLGGADKGDPRIQATGDYLVKGLPKWPANNAGNTCFYYMYYGTLTMFQIGGAQWKDWNEALKNTLLPNQCKGGDDDGSWDPKADWLCEWGGRVYTTAMGALCLEVYYRYLPLYR